MPSAARGAARPGRLQGLRACPPAECSWARRSTSTTAAFAGNVQIERSPPLGFHATAPPSCTEAHPPQLPLYRGHRRACLPRHCFTHRGRSRHDPGRLVRGCWRISLLRPANRRRCSCPSVAKLLTAWCSGELFQKEPH
ncbi:hypothetical protein HPP92_029167 [Vanilla planifolia]|uniref:Uncharacterized protein n=1 Tax=Vanilla planifolia TaxID=51239 RepID=A0A835P4N8_VANPL|nr:hypothetical protein HPP92_029167 [Vanilla planifolia]